MVSGQTNTDVIANFTQGQNRDHMRCVYLLSPGCDALWRRAGGLLLLGRLMHPPPSPLGCLHSRRRQNLCQLAGFSLRAFLSRGYRKPEARQGVASLRRKVTGDALPWGAGHGRLGQQAGATSVAGATNVASSQRGASRGHMEPKRRRNTARWASTILRSGAAQCTDSRGATLAHSALHVVQHSLLSVAS
jgi:hypothetical protein